MILDLGVVRPGATIRIPFSTFDKDDGSSITMTNFLAADVLVYKDGGTTERASTAGFTATTDFDSKTGKHLIVIDLADNTTSGFWSAGSEYVVAIDAVTVDAVTVGGWVARFRIGYGGAMFDTTIASLSSQTSFTLTVGPAEDDALNGCHVIIHDVASAVQCGLAVISDYTGSTKTVTLAAGTTFTVAAGDNISVMFPMPLQPTVAARTLDVSAGGEAGVDWANVGSPTTALNLSGTSTKALEPTTAGRTLDVTATGEAGIDWANVGAPTTTLNLSGTTVKTATDVETDTQDIQGRLPAALTGAGNIKADALALSGDVTAADNAESFFDGTGYAGTNNVIPTVTTLTNAPADSSGVTTLLSRLTSTRAGYLDNLLTLSARSNTAQAGAAGTVTLDASASAVDDFYNDSVVFLTGGTGAGQARLISDYVGATKVASVVPNWATNPDNTSTFAVLPAARVDIATWLGAAVSALISGRVDANAQVVGDKTGYAIGAGGIGAAAFAAGAVDAAALAADAANEIRDAVFAIAMVEPTAAPAITAAFKDAFAWVFALSRNKILQTATTQTLKADDGTTTIATSTHSDDGTTHTRNEWT
jgi:hypothetical protein